MALSIGYDDSSNKICIFAHVDSTATERIFFGDMCWVNGDECSRKEAADVVESFVSKQNETRGEISFGRHKDICIEHTQKRGRQILTIDVDGNTKTLDHDYYLTLSALVVLLRR